MCALLNSSPPQASPGDPESSSWMKRVPLLTGVLAALAGYLTVRSTNLSNDAIFHSNQGVLYQTQASDAWAEYQAGSVKARIVEITLAAQQATLSPETKAQLTAEATELRNRQPPLKAQAEALEKRREEQLAVGAGRLSEKDILAYAGVTTQLGIALASVAALTRRKSVFTLALFLGVGGLCITAYALGVHYLAKL
ncbi:MAG TPA: DUF4337 family protein [Tepidisphaeraceae bacterium]|nr:DUF4337 family protein [Tepidisphaeraceae bacterium]